jgi:hypothetical protein
MVSRDGSYLARYDETKEGDVMAMIDEGSYLAR